VRRLPWTNADRGILSFNWRGDNDDGDLQAYGIYFLRAESAGHVETRKLLFLPVD
jgi:hypothetical protein